MTTVNDALGNPVVLWNWYGYTRTSSGWSHTTVGRASKINEDTGKVFLTGCKVRRYLYGKVTDFRASEEPANVSLRAITVFPVDIDSLRWE